MRNSLNQQKEARRKIFAGILLVLLLAAAAVLFHFRMQKKQQVYQLSVDESALQNTDEGTANYRKIQVNGKTYRYNTSITNYLYMGVDTEDMVGSDVETSAGQADSIMLLSVNRRTKEVQILAIPRDTMTKIRMYDNAGNYLGKATQHLSLAYAYGDGKDKSCQLVAEAVSQLLCDIPVNKYLSSDVSSISQINDLVGGVRVTVPGTDLEYLGPRYQKGKVLTLKGDMAETFVRSRNINEDFTNEGRMIRQKVYMEAFLEKMKEKASADLEGFLEDLEALDDYSVSNLRSYELEDLLSILCDTTLGDGNYHILEGEDRLGELHDEFYVDEEKLQELILELYYVEI